MLTLFPITARPVKHRTNLQLAFVRRPEDIRVNLHELFPALDGIFLRFQIEDRVAADKFFCLGERAVNDGRFLTRRPDVLFAAPNRVVYAVSEPNDQYYVDGTQWGPQKVQANLAWGVWNPALVGLLSAAPSVVR